MQDYTNWLNDLYKNGIIGTNDFGLYYCNPVVNIDTINKSIKFEIVPYLICGYDNETKKYFDSLGISLNELEKIQEKLQYVCVFDLNEDNIDYIMNHLDAMGFINEEVGEKNRYKFENFLISLCEYDLSNFNQNDFCEYFNMPAYCEGYIDVDGVNIF